MRIALLTDGLYPYVMGGMQRHSTMLAQHLPEHGVELVVFHTAHSEPAVAAAKGLQGFPEGAKSRFEHVFVDHPKRGRLPGHYIRDNYAYSKRLLEAYEQCGGTFDFIYAKGLTGHAFVEAKQRGAALPSIGMKAHGYEMFQRAANLRVKMEHLLLRPSFKRLTRESDYIFSYGGKITDIVTQRLGIGLSRIIEIPTGIDPTWLVDRARRGEGRCRFIFLGRYERRKGIEELHAVLRDWTGPDIEFVFVGPIPEANRLDLPWVHYRGSVSSPDALMAELDESDVLVCPSYSEGMPNVIMEAMARGLAIIATNVGAVSAVVNTKNGILIESLSLPKLKAALAQMGCLSREKLSGMKAASLRRAADYTWEKVARDTVKAVQSVLDKK